MDMDLPAESTRPHFATALFIGPYPHRAATPIILQLPRNKKNGLLAKFGITALATCGDHMIDVWCLKEGWYQYDGYALC